MIDVDQLGYTYPGAHRAAVTGVSFHVLPGSIFGLLGPSGAGKSTIQRVLTRQNRRFEGRVDVLSRPLGDWDSRYFDRIGVGFESPNHYPTLTGRENLALFASLYRVSTRPVVELLEAVGLRDAADTRVGRYSKGMQMRLNFARALLPQPEILFLDEPTGGLDPVNSEVIQDLVREQRDRGAAVLLTTHDMTVVEALCDRVGFLVDGRMAIVDTPQRLAELHGERSVRVEFDGPNGTRDAADFPLDGLARDAAFLELIDSSRIHSIHSREASLGQVFARVTGTELRGEAM